MESDEAMLIIENKASDDTPNDCVDPNGDQPQVCAGGGYLVTEDSVRILTELQPSPGSSTEINMDEVKIELDTDIAEQSYLTLPEGKDRHLFVSHSSEDSDKVWPLVQDIEKRFGVKCIYADRDFQPGMDIMTNVKESMERSWKVLFMMSPSFTQSGWCKYERDYAFVHAIESRKGGIIPVLLEECEVPPTMKTMTYIDATQAFCDVPAKIIQAMIKPDIAETMMTFDSIKRYENGFCVDIVAQRDNLWRYRPAKYKFSLEQHHITAIREAQIKVVRYDNLHTKSDYERCGSVFEGNLQSHRLPLSLIEEALTLLNKSRAVRHYDFSVSRKKLLCWTLFLVPILALVIYSGTVSDVGVNEDDRGGYSSSQRGTIFTSLGVAFVILVVIPVCLCVIPIICHRQQVYRDVHTKMWKEMFQRCLEMETILLFDANREKEPTLSVMRYKISECQEFLAHLTLSKLITDKESRAKKYAWNLIVEHLCNVTPVMMSDYDKLPNASYNRHNVRLGKACICQCVEHDVGTRMELMT